MMQYLIEGDKYILHYQELKEQYILHIAMSDEEFMKNLPSALHLACVICFLKEIPTYICLSDKGVIHELTHLLQHGTDELIILKDIRKVFKQQLKLS